MYRFYFADTLDPVEWHGHTSLTLGPYRDAEEALKDLWDVAICGPADLDYLLMTEDQAKSLRKRISSQPREEGQKPRYNIEV